MRVINTDGMGSIFAEPNVKASSIYESAVRFSGMGRLGAGKDEPADLERRRIRATEAVKNFYKMRASSGISKDAQNYIEDNKMIEDAAVLQDALDRGYAFKAQGNRNERARLDLLQKFEKNMKELGKKVGRVIVVREEIIAAGAGAQEFFDKAAAAEGMANKSKDILEQASLYGQAYNYYNQAKTAAEIQKNDLVAYKSAEAMKRIDDLRTKLKIPIVTPPPEEPGFPIVPVAIGAGALLLLIGVLGVFKK